nr:MAG TPA: Protein of unknown function (DUF739) [Caudoviricetes sp.]
MIKLTVRYDYNKLRGLIKEKCGTQENFAKAIGISNTSLSQRLANKVPFNQIEISKACELFGCTIPEADEIFFKIK